MTNTPATVSRADTADVEADGGGCGGGGNAVALLPMQQPVTVEINAPPPIIEHDEMEEEVCNHTLDLVCNGQESLPGVCNIQTLNPQDNTYQPMLISTK